MFKDKLTRIDRIVHDLCREKASIIAAYLFGSIAKNVMDELSDIDVALLLDPTQAEEFDLLSFAVELEKACGRRADVVVLNRAGELLKYEVRRHGRLVFERDADQRKRFEVIGRKRFEDFMYLHRRYTRRVLYGDPDG